MSRVTTRDGRFLDALDDLHVEGILSASAEELEAELLAAGEDADDLAAIADAAFGRARAACAAHAVRDGANPAAPGLDAAAARGGVDDPFTAALEGGLRGVAKVFGCNLVFLGRLKDRLVHVEDLSAGFLDRLAEALGTGAAELARYLAGPARVPAGARFKSNVKPQAFEKQSLTEAIEASGLSEAQKRHLASL